MTGVASRRSAGDGPRRRTTRAGAVAAALALAAACGREAPRPRDVVPGHAWRPVSGRGPTYTFRAGQQVELFGVGGMMMGTYQFATDSTLALDVTGRVLGTGMAPIRVTPRYDVRVLPPGADGRERVEFRAGTAADTLARVD